MADNRRFYVYRLVDEETGETLFEELFEAPEEGDGDEMAADVAKAMLSDRAIKGLLKLKPRPKHTRIDFAEFENHDDDRISHDGGRVCVDWSRCDFDHLDVTLGEED